MKTVKFFTLGCKVNQYETQAIREQFQKNGFRELEDGEPADFCVINTCTVTHKADRDSFSLMRRARRQNPGAKLIVTGCLAQFDANKVKNISGVDLVVKNKDKNRIASLLNNSIKYRASSIEHQSGITYFKNHTRAFLKIQDGCNYRCSYCKVRLVRGSSRSRKLSLLLKEARSLIQRGYAEIVLCGISLGSYGKDLIPASSLAGLIKEIEGIDGVFRLRLSSIEVSDINEKLLAVFKESRRLCRHLHVPLQSADNAILRSMKRSYTADYYMETAMRLKKSLPGLSITTDVMVGFPGESEENFNNTVKFIRKLKPLKVHIFPYSRRENTAAFLLDGALPKEALKLRIQRLQEAANSARLAFCRRLTSKVLYVLIERPVDGSKYLWEGLSGNYIKVRIMSRSNLKNQIVKVSLKEIYQDFILAEAI